MIRPLVAVFVLIGGIFATHWLRPEETTGPHRPLREFPSTIGLWHGENLPFEDEVAHATGADDYINRIYSGDAPPIELYVGYYKDQSSGDRIHSPKNCLPGSGWEPVSSAQLQIGSASGLPVVVNEYVVEQGTHRDMVLYWYQTRGRIVASEYAAKFWLVADGLRHKSTDGAMIRIWTTDADGEASARIRAVNFARKVYPQLATFLPALGDDTHAQSESSGVYSARGPLYTASNEALLDFRRMLPTYSSSRLETEALVDPGKL